MKDTDKKLRKRRFKNLLKISFLEILLFSTKTHGLCILMRVSQTVPDFLNQFEGYFKINLIFYCYLMTAWKLHRGV